MLLGGYALGLMSFDVNLEATPSCFSVARDWVISQEGEINLENVGHVLELTEYLQNNSTICE